MLETIFKCLDSAPFLLNTTDYLLNPYSRVIHEKLTGSQPIKTFPAFYGTRRVIKALTRVRQLSLT